MRLQAVLFVIGTAAAAIAFVLAPGHARAAASQAWPPFVLVAGLLAIGAIAQADGLFEAAGHAVARLRAPATVVLCAVLALVATVTAVLNLDTAAAFLTPVAVLAARRRGVREDAFLYGALFMTNAASLLLPGSNLTNLLVLGHDHLAGPTFAARMLPAWLAAVVLTGAFVVVRWRHDLRVRPFPMEDSGAVRIPWEPVVVVATAALLVVALPSPALPVVGVATIAGTIAVRRGVVSRRRVARAVDPAVLGGLFGIAVALGTVARSWHGPARLMAASTGAVTVVVAALGSVMLNNLPSAIMFTAGRVAHPRALLLGLDLGPNLAVSGSLSAFVWIKAARAVGAEPDWRRVSRIGVLLVPLSLLGAAGALALVASPFAGR